jgi:hypothetical protein
MNNKTLIERLKVVGKHYNTHHDLFLLCREATAEIERLQTELDFTIKALYASPYNLALAPHSDKRFSGYETIHINKDEVNWNDDLTVRDHIAIAAMEGLTANGLRDPETIARAAYQQADAMLKARERK